MILFNVSLICVIFLLFLSYKKLIINLNKITILVFPGVINFMLGFSFILMFEELYLIAILTGFLTFLIFTSILVSNNNKPKITGNEPLFLNQTATITGFIVKSHKYYVYIAEIRGLVIFVNSSKPLEINSQVTLTNYNNERYFV